MLKLPKVLEFEFTHRPGFDDPVGPVRRQICRSGLTIWTCRVDPTIRSDRTDSTIQTSQTDSMIWTSPVRLKDNLIRHDSQSRPNRRPRRVGTEPTTEKFNNIF